MNERAERINGWAAMLGVVAAMGSYAITGQLIPVFGDRRNVGISIWIVICLGRLGIITGC